MALLVDLIPYCFYFLTAVAVGSAVLYIFLELFSE